MINWDHRGRDIIGRLAGVQQSPARRAVVVVTPAPVDFVAENCLEEIVPVQGDATKTECLKKARVAFAHSIMVLSSWRRSDPNDRRQSVDSDVADAKTIETLRIIRRLCSEEAPKGARPVVTAEIRSRANLNEAELAGGDDIHAEIVCVDALGNDVLVQSALTPGLATLYSRLISTKGNGVANGAKVLIVPPEVRGRVFSETLKHFAERRQNHEPPIIPLGVCRGFQVFLNPSDEEVGRLEDSDLLFVVSDRTSSGGKGAQ